MAFKCFLISKPKRKSDWYKFCFGKIKKTSKNESADECTDSNFKENRPLLSFMYRMPQVR